MVQQSNNTQGETVAGFHIIRELGRGNNGVVYLARQIALDRQVALKILLPELAAEDPTYIRNFLHEARLAARLDHPNIVQALDAGETPAGLYFFAMEFVDGKSLEDIRQQQPELISLRFLLEVSLQLADAMDYAWRSHKMTHGDIKPGNLLIRSSDGAVKLADLGLARVSGAAGNDEIMATPMYAAPEVIMGQNDKIGPCTDIYSFGVMFYELAAGTAPFHGNTEEMLRQHLEDEPTPLILSNPDIDPDISKFVARMLRKDPADRVSDWQEVRNFLESVRNKQLERARMTQRRLPAVAPARQLRPPRPRESLYDYCLQRPLILALLAIVITAALTAFGFFVYTMIRVAMPESELVPIRTEQESSAPPPEFRPAPPRPELQVAISSPAVRPRPFSPQPEPPRPVAAEPPRSVPPPAVRQESASPAAAEPPEEKAEETAPVPPVQLPPSLPSRVHKLPYDAENAARLARQMTVQINRLGSTFTPGWKQQAARVASNASVVLAQLAEAGFPGKEMTRFDVFTSGRSSDWQSYGGNTGVIRLSAKTPPDRIARELGVGLYEKLRERRLAPAGMSDEFGDAIQFFVEQRESTPSPPRGNPVLLESGYTLGGFIDILKAGGFRRENAPGRRYNR